MLLVGIHDPPGLRYRFQLRVSLSLLRSHKGSHNFINTPPEICVIKALKIHFHVLFTNFTEQPNKETT